ANKEKKQKRPTKSATELWENITPDDTEYYKSNINLYPFHNQLLQALKDLGLQCEDWRIMIAAKAMRNVDVYWGVEPSNFVEIAARFSQEEGLSDETHARLVEIVNAAKAAMEITAETLEKRHAAMGLKI